MWGFSERLWHTECTDSTTASGKDGAVSVNGGPDVAEDWVEATTAACAKTLGDDAAADLLSRLRPAIPAGYDELNWPNGAAIDLPIVDQLRNGETPTHARLGVSVANASSDNGLLTGAGIQDVTAGSAADEAGLQQGDVVTKVDDHVISDSESLVATIRGYRPGDQVTLTFVRGNGDPQTATATLDSDEGQAAS